VVFERDESARAIFGSKKAVSMRHDKSLMVVGGVGDRPKATTLVMVVVYAESGLVMRMGRTHEDAS
jgi:hypothetical protein